MMKSFFKISFLDDDVNTLADYFLPAPNGRFEVAVSNSLANAYSDSDLRKPVSAYLLVQNSILINTQTSPLTRTIASCSDMQIYYSCVRKHSTKSNTKLILKHLT